MDISSKRGAFSIVILLGLVIAVSTQLVTGLTMMVHPGNTILTIHVFVGVLTIALTAAEWMWLAFTPAGHYRLLNYFSHDSSIVEWSESAFLIVVTATVVLGGLLALSLYGESWADFGTLLSVHRALAIAVLVLYIPHSVLAIMQRNNQNKKHLTL